MKRNIYKYTYFSQKHVIFLRKNKKGSYQDAKKFIMNHINKCIYEKELEWNGIVNNKAWSRVLNKKRCVF